MDHNTDPVQIKQALSAAFGANLNKLDGAVVEYLLSVLQGFDEDKEELGNIVSPFVEDADIDESQREKIIDSLWDSLGGKSEGGHQKLLEAIDLEKISQGIDAEVEKKIAHLKFEQSANFETQSDGKPLLAPKTRKTKEPPKKERISFAKAPSSFMKKRTGAPGFGNRDIIVRNFDVSIGGKKLLIDSSLTLSFGRSYGLVGRNGFGKTTLFRALSNGEIDLPNNLTMLHVEQEVIGDDTTALDSVLEADGERTELLLEEKRLLSSDNRTEEDDKLLQNIYNQLAEIEADRAPATVALLLNGLGFTSEMQKKATKEFSGGWRMRLALARALFCQPDLLLLDEPTNMLDVQAVLWLETYLQTKWEKTLFVISHDREFLNAVTTDIYYLHDQKLTHYTGNYDKFEETRNEHLRNQQAAFQAQEAHRQHIQTFIDRFRFNANRAALVQSRIKFLNKLQTVPAVIEDPSFHFDFPNPEPLPPPILSLQDVSFSYSPSDKLLFQSVDMSVDMETRMALVGANGQGKSTMLSLLIGELQPTKGFGQINRRARIAKFSQFHVDQMPLDKSPFEFLQSEFPGKDQQVYRSALGKYGLSGDIAFQKSETLSGGQKSRVVWAHMAMKQPHIMVFDEPTNHLDIETVDVLVQALNMFEGGIVLVSHDERLIKYVCNELWIVHNGTCTSYSGTFDSYKKKMLQEIQLRAEGRNK